MESGAGRPVPVLPLADAVLFPHSLLALRVTELRYRKQL